MGAFRRRAVVSATIPECNAGDDTILVPVTRTVKEKGSTEPTTYVEMKRKKIADYAEELGLPADENYQLRDMLAQGVVPEEVPVRGMLDSTDTLDLSNAGVEDALFNKVSKVVNASKKTVKPVEPANPAEPVEPAPAE